MIPLTPTNIDKITNFIFGELYKFSYDLAHAKIKGLTPPFLDYLNGSMDVIQYLDELFDIYCSEL